MLSSFYTSKRWINFVAELRHERINAEGLLICEHCGKPIIHKYDCIAHHEEELTEDNYQDYDISLNPDNIKLVHHACHNKIHDRLGLSYIKQVFLVFGSPLSGKSTWVNENKNYGDIIIDIDSIWECISGCDRYIKPKRLTQNVFAVRDLMLDMVKVRRGNWLNAYIVGGYPISSYRERLIQMLGAREIFIDTPKAECIDRLYNSDRPKDEWMKYIDDWWDQYSPRV